MMVDIFSSFDPYINHSFQAAPLVFWGLIVFSLILISSSFWMMSNEIYWITSFGLNIMNMQSLRTTSYNIKGFTSIVVSLFVMLIMINLLGLLPYSFAFSSHMVFSLSFGLPIWFFLILSSVVNSPYSFLASLLPSGAPDWLNPFLVLIESISIIVRPLTLSVRLVANMSAGHIVLSLIAVYSASFIFLNIFVFLFLIIVQIGYIVFEMGICVIQAYIFSLLSTLYANDHS